MAQRRVIRGGKPKSFKARFQRFLTSFTPNGFKRYWLNREGAIRAGKIAGWGFLLLFLVFLFFAKDLPSPGKINARIGSQTTRFYDRTGQTLLYEVHGDKNRTVIDFNQMPDTLKKATVAIEDKDFYHHGAFSSFGILRAAFIDLFHRNQVVQGGSTITQQYVKNALLDPNSRSITRKIKELILSLEIEQLYKKDDILKLYLNEIPYGSQAYGVKAASNTYFSYPEDVGGHKKGDPLDPKDLTLDEAAMLAAIPNAPTYYSPYGSHRDALIGRQQHILDLMAEQKLITHEQADAAKKEDVLGKLNPAPKLYANVTAPHFVQYVQEILESKYGVSAVETGGWKVITSLDLGKQKLAEQAVKDNMSSIRAGGGSNSALVAGDPKTGQILAMVGSYDFSEPKFGAFNVATANRQPGSSFKPFVYSTAFKKNWGAGSTLYDVTTDFGGGYKPKNYSGSNYGVVSMRKALGGSLNIPAVKTLYLAGIADSLKTAHDMGITTLNKSPDNYGLSLVLGSGEVKLVDMVNGYESFATEGVHHDSTPLVKIIDARGATFEDHSKADGGKRVLDPQIAYLISDILSDNPSRAFIFNNLLAVPGRRVAVKTGTTEFYNDAWTVGYTPSLTAGVWVGNNDNAPMQRQASAIAAPVWKDFMVKALAGTPTEDFKRPSGLKNVTLDANTGKLPGPNTRSTRTDLFPSWYKPENVAGSRTANVDKVSGKLATECTPAAAVESRTSSEVHAEIPANDPAYPRWEPPVAALARSLGYAAGGSLPTAPDDIHHCSDVKPAVHLSVSGSGPLHITATVTSGTFAPNNLTIYFDDQIISSNSGTSYEFDYNPPSNGSHTIKAHVSDVAMYEGSDETAVNVTGAGGAGNGGFQGSTNKSSYGVGESIVFTWQSLGPGVTYHLTTTMPGCGATTSSTSAGCTAVGPPGTTYHWSVSGDGQTSDTYTFSVH